MTAGLSTWVEKIGAGTEPAWLSPDEELRAARFHFLEDRIRWRRGRAWIRQRLGDHLGRNPRELVFHVDSHGRPSVATAPPEFDCNWSHAGDWMALAVSTTGPVGIDIEVVRPDFPALEVSEQFFTGTEHAALSAAPDTATRQRLFFNLWTAKEALMKATGLGLSLDPRAIDVHLDRGQPAGYASHPAWQVEMRAGDGCVLAVASLR